MTQAGQSRFLLKKEGDRDAHAVLLRAVPCYQLSTP